MCPILIVLFFVSFICLSSLGFAEFYSYNEKIDVDSGGKTIGYVEPYKISSIFGEYAYLKWKRNGYPEGNTFPVFLVKGTYVPLVFGVELDFLNVKINDISSNGVDLTIDKSSLEETIETAVEIVPDSVESLVDETPHIVEDAADSLSKEIDAFNEDMIKRATKFVSRGYYSSLHIVDSKDAVSLKVSNSIKDREALMAEKISDKIIPLVIDTFVACNFPVTSIAYNEAVRMVPPSIRHELTKFLLNINTKYDSYTDSKLGGMGVYTLYIGNPSVNSLSDSLNDELKKEGLPHFENDVIVGERRYVDDSIGIIAAIPEERVWRTDTLEVRLSNDRVRLYKTLIAGIGDDGTMAAGKWYGDQLDTARKFITSSLSLSDGSDVGDVLKIVQDSYESDPKATFSSSALLQGWVIGAMNSLEKPDLSKVDSLGYVVIVKKNKETYDVLEVHTITGHKSDSFLYDYVPVVRKVDDDGQIGVGEVARKSSSSGDGSSDSLQAVLPEESVDVDVGEEAPPATGKVIDSNRKRVESGVNVNPIDKMAEDKNQENKIQEGKNVYSDSLGLLGGLNIMMRSVFDGLFGWLR